VTEKIKYRLFVAKLFRALVLLISFIAILPIIFIIYYITKSGISVINFDFIFNLPKPQGELGGGVANAIVGSAIVIFFASLIAIPLSILVGVFLAEFKDSRIAWYGRYALEILQGIPSIVVGIVVYLVLVKPLNGFNAFSGAVALAIMMIPIVAKSTEETLKLIPISLKEASSALGVPYYKTILKVVIPTGFNGIITGIILGIARIAGETAPLLFTAFGTPFMSYYLDKPINTLPVQIFKYADSPYQDWQDLAWGASFLLLLIVLTLNLIAKFVASRWKIQF
jgi:phosphate transport system permease protein